MPFAWSVKPHHTRERPAQPAGAGLPSEPPLIYCRRVRAKLPTLKTRKGIPRTVPRFHKAECRPILAGGEVVSGPPGARLLQHELPLPRAVGARTHPRGAPSARGRLSSFSTPLGLTAPPRYLTSILTPVGHMPPTHLHTLTNPPRKSLIVSRRIVLTSSRRGSPSTAGLVAHPSTFRPSRKVILML